VRPTFIACQVAYAGTGPASLCRQPAYGMAATVRAGFGRLAALKAAIERDDPRPLWICLWAARIRSPALMDLRSAHSRGMEKLLARVRVLDFRQDDAGVIRREFQRCFMW